MLSGKTFFVTGATGRVGCALTVRLEELGARVLPAVLPSYPKRPKSVDWTAASEPIEIGEVQDLTNLPSPDHAIHLHWKVDRSRPFTEQIVNELEWNVHRPAFVWYWLEKQSIASFVNCSSVRVFSHLNEGPVTSATEPRPLSPYGIAKYAGEKYFTAFFAGSRTRVTHARLCSVYSVGEHSSHLMSRLYSSAFDGEPITLNTGHSANLIHIDEAVDLVIGAALRARRERYLLATPAVAIDDIAKTFERICGRRLNAEYADLDPGVRDVEFAPDVDDLRADWTRTVTLEEGIRRVISARGGRGLS